MLRGLTTISPKCTSNGLGFNEVISVEPQRSSWPVHVLGNAVVMAWIFARHRPARKAGIAGLNANELPVLRADKDASAVDNRRKSDWRPDVPGAKGFSGSRIDRPELTGDRGDQQVISPGDGWGRELPACLAQIAFQRNRPKDVAGLCFQTDDPIAHAAEESPVAIEWSQTAIGLQRRHVSLADDISSLKLFHGERVDGNCFIRYVGSRHCDLFCGTGTFIARFVFLSSHSRVRYRRDRKEPAARATETSAEPTADRIGRFELRRLLTERRLALHWTFPRFVGARSRAYHRTRGEP